MARNLVRGLIIITATAVALPPPAFAQPKPVPAAETGTTEFNVEQLDAMLAPVALYPDELLTQVLMASTYPLQVVAASRWLEKGDNKNLKEDALAKALESESWDPSVKSLVPFPQVIATLNDNLEWTQQLGYAVATQQAAVLDSIQRLRRQAQKAGSLKTTEQQRVVVQEDNVVIQPADPETVYVPVYNPTEVYGEWLTPPTHPSLSRRSRRIIRMALFLAPASPLRPASPWSAGCGGGHGRHGTAVRSTSVPAATIISMSTGRQFDRRHGGLPRVGWADDLFGHPADPLAGPQGRRDCRRTPSAALMYKYRGAP
jgi:Protein of unknown function (DUF3300)